MKNFQQGAGRSLCSILLLAITFLFTAEYTSGQDVRAELDSTYLWFRSHPPKPDGSNFQSRREKTVLLDKLGWQISHKTWGLYRSSWNTDTAKTLMQENANPLLYYLHQALDKAIGEIENTHLSQGVVIWKLYNMGYVVKTKDVCFAVDLAQCRR